MLGAGTGLREGNLIGVWRKKGRKKKGARKGGDAEEGSGKRFRVRLHAVWG